MVIYTVSSNVLVLRIVAVCLRVWAAPSADESWMSARLRLRKLHERVMTGDWLLFLIDDRACHKDVIWPSTRR